MSTHPAEVNEHLGLAYQKCLKLMSDAERRDDKRGAEAWAVALRVIEAAEIAMREARELQTWDRRAEAKTPPMVPVLTCGAVFRLRGQSVTKQCTAEPGHKGSHRE